MKIIKLCLVVGIILLTSLSFGQYYYLTSSGDTPGGLNQDPALPDGSGQVAGWTSLLGPSVGTPTWSANQTIPFTFNFNGAVVTDYKVSSTGVLTFSTGAVLVPGGAPASLPDASIPDNSICAWGLEASGINDHVSIKTFGSAGSQQEWIHFSSCTNGTIGWSYWSIVLEEGTDNIYIVDQRNTSGTGALSIGVQIDGTTAISDPASPSVDATAGGDVNSIDDLYYTFFYGTQPANEVELLSFDMLSYIGVGVTDIEGTVKNLGSSPITTLTVTWDDGTGPYMDNITGLNILSDEEYSFTSPTQLNAVAGTGYTIDLVVMIAGDVDLSNNSDQQSTVALTSLPVKYVVGEEKTGTWCGWCPRGAVALAEMESVPEFIGIAVHNGSNDPMVLDDYDGNINTYIPGGYPKGGVDRVASDNPANFLAMHNARVGAIVPCDVKNVTAIYSAQTNDITVYAESEWFGTIAGDYRFSLVIVEDDLIGDGSSGWDQVNYYDGEPAGTMQFPAGTNNDFDFSTGGDPVDPALFGGYDHVARYLSNDDILGDAGSLPAGSVPMGIQSHTFAAVPIGTVTDVNKSHAIVMIVNSNTGEILNATETVITGDVGIKEIANEFNFNLYPNPASNNVNVSFQLKNASDVIITVTNALGNEVMVSDVVLMNGGKQYLTINGSNLSEGFYFVNLNVGGEVVTKRLTVVH
ncbi:MAG: T9SS type A sorting domain-containing protein [Crocinitomicaceae bacterium]|nr:T9SS type A sorting domain-containing protein [Crocinitomicaceae bacterium]